MQYEEGTSITIPSGIVVNEINVEENDFVSKGDVLAVVDQVSVLRAMEDIQEEMDELDEQIDDSKDATDSESITAKTDGTVKKIYVQEGQEAAECMLEQGALLLLSIDGSAEEGEEEDELAITVATGTIEEVCVSEGEEVYAGTTLLKIASAGQSLEYQERQYRGVRRNAGFSECGHSRGKSREIRLYIHSSAECEYIKESGCLSGERRGIK